MSQTVMMLETDLIHHCTFPKTDQLQSVKILFCSSYVLDVGAGLLGDGSAGFIESRSGTYQTLCFTVKPACWLTQNVSC